LKKIPYFLNAVCHCFFAQYSDSSQLKYNTICSN